MNDVAAAIRSRLNGDLRDAMKSRDLTATRALRSLLAALDNASAVPVSDASASVFRRSNDVPRRALSAQECESVLRNEAHSRSLAIAQYEQLGRSEDAEILRAELSVIYRYVSTA